MRKTLSILLLTVLLILLLAACGKKEELSVPTIAPPTPTQFKQSLPLQGNEAATLEPGPASPTESPLPTPVSPLPTPTPSPTS